MKKKFKAFLTILGMSFLGDIILLLIYGVPIFTKPISSLQP